MKRKRTFTIPACCLLLALNMPLGNLFGQRTQFDPEAAKSAIAEIEAVSPAEERMVLIYSVTNAFSHPSVPHGKKVLELLGDKNGAYQAVVSDDPAYFEKESLSGFDAVVFNNTSGSTLLGISKRDFQNLDEEEQAALRESEARYKENLMEYIRGGGGFVGIQYAVGDLPADATPKQ